MQRTLVALQKLNVRVLILLGGPEFRVPPVLCADLGYGKGVCDETLKDVDEYRRSTVEVLRQTADKFDNVRVVDPMPFFCTGNDCPGFIQGHPVVYDDSHISLYSAKAFAPFMRQDFRWMLEASEPENRSLPARGVRIQGAGE
jgi:hypothetical protein